MTNKPNSDKSGRATRRRAERELAKATPTGTAPTPAPTLPTVTAADLFSKIGALAVERDILAGQLEQTRQTVAKLMEELQEAGGYIRGSEEGPPVEEEE